mmetsp:Transcript_33873/g.88149  ORF Transcript_33873/g.88149 Transcript_33873/m.88149 type:complete len:521 (+) Transcript_33873:545-2107(+)
MIFDVMEASSWPFRSLDVQMLMSRASQAAQLPGSWNTTERFVVLYDAEAAAVGDFGQPIGARQGLPPPYWPFFSTQHLLEPARVLGNVSVAVFGLHGALKMEPATTLKQAVPNLNFHFTLLGTDCRPGDMTQRASCHLLCKLQHRCNLFEPQQTGEGFRGGIQKDRLGFLLARAMDQARAGASHDEFQSTVAEFQEVARTTSALVNADLFVCVDGIYCTLFRPVLPGTPFLLYLSHVLVTTHGDLDSQIGMLDALRLEVEQGTAVAAVAYAQLAIWAWYSGAMKLPVVRTEALYWPKFAPDLRRGVFIARTRFWLSYSGQHAINLFYKLIQANGLSDTMLEARFTSPREFVEYHEIVTHQAAVLFPISEYVMIFDELYTLGMPLFMPTKEWLVRVWRPSSYMSLDARTFYPEARVPKALQLEKEGVVAPYFPMLPFATAIKLDPDEFRVYYFWYDTCPFAYYPHIQKFASIPDLIDQLLRLDAARRQELTTQMRQYVASVQGETFSWYRSALSRLMNDRK